MKSLKQIDKVAYIRFASVYRDFKDVGEFHSELESLLNAKTKNPSRSRPKPARSKDRQSKMRKIFAQTAKTAGDMGHKVTLIPGDGIGPEVTNATVRIVDASGVKIEWERFAAGSEAFAKYRRVHSQRADPLH